MKLKMMAQLALIVPAMMACEREAEKPATETPKMSQAPTLEEAATALIERRSTIFEPDRIVWTHQHMAELFPSRTISRGPHAHPFASYPIELGRVTYSYGEQTFTIDEFLARNNTQGIVVLHKGTVVYEKYFGDAEASTRFTSWSVGKSITSTLVGIAIDEGLIKDVTDQLTDYIPELVGTAYDGVTIEQTLQMSSGVKFNEDYQDDGTSDIWSYMGAAMIANLAPANESAAQYPRENEPGTAFNYNTAETQILGWLITKVTGQPFSEYLQDKIWEPLGMAHDATWLMDKSGKNGMEVTGCCLNAALRDWARFGEMFRNGGVAHKKQIVSREWVEDATRPSQPHLIFKEDGGDPIYGYQYQWWLVDRGRYSAEGVHGQYIFVAPDLDLVIAKASTWPIAWDEEMGIEAVIAFDAIGRALN